MIVCFDTSALNQLMDKPCHDFLYMSGAFRRLDPVGTNAKRISC
jgi:hypothetical protein